MTKKNSLFIFLIFVLTFFGCANAKSADAECKPQERIKTNLHFIISCAITLDSELQYNEGALAANGNFLYVIHRTGEIEVLDTSNLISYKSGSTVPFQDFPQRYVGERGLPGVKGAYFDTQTNSLLVSATLIDRECVSLALYRFKVSDLILSEAQKLWMTPTCVPLPTLRSDDPAISANSMVGQPNISEAGGRILKMNASGDFIITVGNFGDERISNVQWKSEKLNSKIAFGKIIKLNIFSKQFQVISTGNRNPQGIVFSDLLRKYLFSEHGPEGGDELNILTSGDYGWPEISLGHRYSQDDGSYSNSTLNSIEPALTLNKSIEPFYSWTPSIAPNVLARIPPLQTLRIPKTEEYFLGSLRDQALHRILISNSRVIFDERIYLGYRIRDFLFSRDNILWVLDDTSVIHKLIFLPRKTN